MKSLLKMASTVCGEITVSVFGFFCIAYFAMPGAKTKTTYMWGSEAAMDRAMKAYRADYSRWASGASERDLLLERARIKALRRMYFSGPEQEHWPSSPLYVALLIVDVQLDLVDARKTGLFMSPAQAQAQAQAISTRSAA